MHKIKQFVKWVWAQLETRREVHLSFDDWEAKQW